MGCAGCCKCGMAVRIVLLVLLVALVLTSYLVHEYYLKPWGADRLDDYAASLVNNPNSINATATDEEVACIMCTGVNNMFPVSERSHPTYGSFQIMMINNGAWVTSMLMVIAVSIGGGGSLIITLLNAYNGVSITAASPTSSTAQNGCGLFEMVFMVSQAQFITMLGSLQLEGTPLFFLEFAKRLAWTNLQIFIPEVSYDPNAEAAVDTITTRSLLSYDEADTVNATGVERYALLIGATPNHLFYYTALVLAIVLGGVIFCYLVLRVAIGRCKKDVAASLDHRVIWLVLQVLMLAQYAVAMTACFQIYYTLTAEDQSTGDIGLAIVILAAVCLGLLIFGVVKIARHRDDIKTHGTKDHDDSKPFHLRYSVFYLDYTVQNVFFFAARLVLDAVSGVIVALVQDAPLQISLLVALNGGFLVLLILRQPYLVPMFYVMMVLAGYLRIVLLMLTLVQAKADLFSQDVRDYVAVLIIVINAVLLICMLVRQFYVFSVSIFRWASRPRQPVADEELGIPLVDRAGKDNKPPAAAAPGSGKKSKGKDKDKKADAKGEAKPAAETKPPSKKKDKNEVKDSTLFAQQPYQELKDDKKKKAGSGGSTSSRRSLYSAKKSERKKYAPVKDEDLPDWAKV